VGFSTHNESFGFYNNQWIELVAIIFMIAAGLNFSLHYLAFKNKSLDPYKDDNESYSFIFITIFISILTIFYLYQINSEMSFREIIKNVFYAVSISTTTGFTNSDYLNYVGFLPILLILFSFIGGCALKQLKAKLYEIEIQKKRSEQENIESQKADIGWGSQIRSYVLDQSRIKDLRTNIETSNTQSVLDGNIDMFVEASLKMGDKNE